MDSFDVVIIGSGPGGYVCAIRAAQLGMRVAVIEKRPTFGGTCLNIGCIPSKALLYASECFAEAAGDHFSALGINTKTSLDLVKMMRHKQETVDANVQGVAFLFKKNKIKSYTGTGKLTEAGQIEIDSGNGDKKIIGGQHIVIATGSDTVSLPGINIDEQRIISSTGALDLTAVPKKMLVIGAGVIGLELGSVWRRLGCEVRVVEFLDRILPGMDNEVARKAQAIFKKQGISFDLSTKLTSAMVKGNKVHATLESANDTDKKPENMVVDNVLVAVGRRPYTTGLNLDRIGVATDDKGRVITDSRYQTNVKGIYAIGDVIAGPMLAHKAEDEGIALAEILAGQAGHVNYQTIPGVVYTEPEIAAVGKTEEQLKDEGVSYNKGSFSFMANGRARSMKATDGFVKILADKHSDRVLGVHIVGANAGEMIHEACVIMEFGGAAEDIARTCHAHPTMSEAIREAALAVGQRAIHS